MDPLGDRYEVPITVEFLLTVDCARDADEAREVAGDMFSAGETGVLNWSEIGEPYTV